MGRVATAIKRSLNLVSQFFAENTTATHEVDDFEPIAVSDFSLGPQISGDDFAVVFDGDAVTTEFEQRKNAIKQGRCSCFQLSRLAVDLKLKMGGHTWV